MKSFVVGMSVGAFPVAHIYGPDLEIIMHILVGPGSYLFQQFFHIFDEERFRFIHDYGHSSVHTLDIDYAILDAGFFYLLLDLIGDVDEVQGGGSFEVDNFVDDFHGLILF
jgi:hypothetical protein